MDKLQYDSFYKFLVSLGIILIAAPVLCLYFVVNNQEQLLISQNEYEALSEASLFLLQEREKILGTIYNVLPWVLPILFACGIFCLIYGGFKWKTIQDEIDEQTHLKTVEQRTNVEKMSLPEVVEKAISEGAEVEAATESDSIGSGDISNQTSIAKIQKERILKYLQIEDLSYKYLLQRLSKRYFLKQNVKVKKHEYDIIATSKKMKSDIIYEIKYWTNPPTATQFQNTLHGLDKRGIDYETNAHRNFRNILFIVIPKSEFKKVKFQCDKLFYESPSNFTILNYVTEEELLEQ